MVLGIVLVVVGLLVGPGGVSIFAAAPTLSGVFPTLRRHRLRSLEVGPPPPGSRVGAGVGA